MSRSRAPSAGGAPERELLSAYVDGVSELSADERRRVEARLAGDGDARAEQAAVRGLVDRLRALSPEGTEPDWAQLERSIREAVGASPPRPWWRRWTWLAPAATLATAAAVLLVLWSSPDQPAPRPLPAASGGSAVAERSAPVERAAADRTGADDDATVPLWLDGAEVDVDVDLDARAADLLGEADDDSGDPEDADAGGASLLPSDDLDWVDHLDDASLTRAEHWLAGAKSGKKG